MPEEPGADDPVGFAEKLLALLETAPVSTTYKYAVLLALIDAAVETADPSGHAPAAIATERLALKVFELYWPQARPYAAAGGMVLRQSRSGQAEIVSAIRQFRDGSELSDPWSKARQERPFDFDQLLARIELKLAEEPLPRLAATPGWNVFKVSWAPGISSRTFRAAEFPRIVELALPAQAHLLRLSGLLRAVLFRHWTVLVMAMNRSFFHENDLEDFLFGAERVALTRIRRPLSELQGGLCFYCGVALGAEIDVDHFLPWSRYVDNGLENLVASHRRCNLAKSAFLAAPRHLEHWRESRAAGNIYDHDLRQMADALAWEYRPDIALSAARGLYFSLGLGAKLWIREKELVDYSASQVRAILA